MRFGGKAHRAGGRRRTRPPRRGRRARSDGLGAIALDGSPCTPKVHISQWWLAHGRTISKPRCKRPRFPVHAPRSGIAVMFPIGVTRFWRGSDKRSSCLAGVAHLLARIFGWVVVNWREAALPSGCSNRGSRKLPSASVREYTTVTGDPATVWRPGLAQTVQWPPSPSRQRAQIRPSRSSCTPAMVAAT